MFKLIIGPMYSGKSSKLIEILDRFHIGKKKVLLIRSNLDKRNYISRSKDMNYIYDIIVSDSDNLIIDVDNYDIIGIDELQFFNIDTIYNFIINCLNKNKIIIGCGLLATSELKIFTSISKVIPLATSIEKLNAVCHVCGNEASYTYCKKNKKTDIQVDNGNMYEARCWNCYNNKKEN